jgi:hypothetical protein
MKLPKTPKKMSKRTELNTVEVVKALMRPTFHQAAEIVRKKGHPITEQNATETLKSLSKAGKRLATRLPKKYLKPKKTTIKDIPPELYRNIVKHVGRWSLPPYGKTPPNYWRGIKAMYARAEVADLFEKKAKAITDPIRANEARAKLKRLRENEIAPYIHSPRTVQERMQQERMLYDVIRKPDHQRKL